MKFVKPALFLVALCATFAFGFWWNDVRTGTLPSADPFVSLLTGRYQSQQSPTEIFRQHYNQILVEYRRPLDSTKLKYSGMSGMFAALGDPHTVFLEPATAQQFDLETTGNFVGIGARLSSSTAGAEVFSVFPDAPASNAGLKAGDLITAVDGKEVAGMTTTDIVTLIKGEAGTPVKLRLVREGVDEPFEVRVIRAEVVIPSAMGKYLEKQDIGYIEITQFSEPTYAQFVRAWDEIDKHTPRGLVIDVRDNPGGLLETAIEMLSLFVDDKPAVTLEARDSHTEVIPTESGQTRDINYPVVVLVNGNSASAAEIFAGVLKDYERASLVGERTYGKASVQNVWSMIDRSSAKVTIAKYYLPAGGDIHRRLDEDGNMIAGGVSPDYEVELELGPETVIGDPEHDSQLSEAIRIIEMKLGG